MSQSRQPKGVPIGGQFAESAHEEATSVLPHGQSISDRLSDSGDSVLISSDLGQFHSLYRDSYGDTVLTSGYSLDWGKMSVEAHRFVSDHEGQYDDLLHREYGARSGTARRPTLESVIDGDTDEDVSREMRSDARTAIERDIASGALQSKIEEMAEKDTLRVEGIATPRGAIAQAEEYFNSGRSEISGEAARRLAKDFTRGGSARQFPHLSTFANEGTGSREDLHRDLMRVTRTDNSDAAFVALEGFLLND